MSIHCSRPVAVDPCGSWLVDETGKPWFYLADTAWEFAHRLTLAEADLISRPVPGSGSTRFKS